MKKIILLSLIILFNNFSAHSQSTWFWQQPLPTGNYLYSVDFVNTNTGYAVGTVGTIMKTTNGGTNWEVQNSGFTSNLLGTNFFDANLGFAVGSNNGTILRTNNGGYNWTQVFSGATTSMWSIDFPTRNIGYAVGLNGVVLKSTNEGISWLPLSSGTSASLFSVSFLDSLNGVASGSRKVIKTSDGGLNWVSQDINFINM
ncbi:MAG: YCF48-related protein, partial [Bacteroidota bacterium]|nr:YCF48-related protein [Bacteroidota bacterium]